MKAFQVFSLVLLVAFTEANIINTKKIPFAPKTECTNANFWCQNILTAKTCNAVDYCIKAVWETHTPTFSSTQSNAICDECKSWVAKARSIVQDNDVEVVRNLEAICHYIPIRQWENSCVKIVEEDAASVIKMIESKMDPDVVCSNLFLCNNDELIGPLDVPKKSPPKCSQCNVVGKILEDNWANSDQDAVLERMLGICGELSSYSDSCTTIVMTYFDEIYSFMRKNIKAKQICGNSCSMQKRTGIVDIVPALDDSSVPCELCQQLFVHLSELLLINTSEIEFKNMLLGFCHEMGSFNNQCVSIVDEYHETIYKFLKDNLNANKTCVAAGICNGEKQNFAMPRQPLLLNEMYPLPKTVIEMKLDPSLNLKHNGTLCATCESFIHLIHEVLEKQIFDDEILNETKRLCLRLPETIRPECLSMVDLYGDAVIQLWSQNMNPNEICPMIKLCPPILSLDYLQKTAIQEKPTCPFCLMAMQDIKDYISSNNTKENIESALSRLCNHLSNKLLSQCTEFVKTYSSEVVDMLIADFTPQEACTFIKLCTEDKEHEHSIVKIQDDEVIVNPQCQLCKEIVKIVEERVINKKSKDEIRRELENSCNRLKKFSSKCKEFVDKYSDKIVDLIEQELEPEEVCRQLIFCVTEEEIEFQDYDSGLEIFTMSEKKSDVIDEISLQPQCVICEFVVAKIDDELNDKNVTEHLKQEIRNICSKMPQTINKECQQFIDYYYNMIIMMIETTKPADMCGEMKLCPFPKLNQDELVGMIQNDIYKCALCKGIVQGLDTIIEDPYTDANLENLEEKLCIKFAGKYKTKCHEIASQYGLMMINLMKSITNSDEICLKLELCDISSSHGTLQIADY